jgi:hypothetical protein
VTCRPIARERAGKTRFHRDRFLETNSVQNTFLGIRKGTMFPQRYILGNQTDAVESTGVSVDSDTLYKRPFKSE